VGAGLHASPRRQPPSRGVGEDPRPVSRHRAGECGPAGGRVPEHRARLRAGLSSGVPACDQHRSPGEHPVLLLHGNHDLVARMNDVVRAAFPHGTMRRSRTGPTSSTRSSRTRSRPPWPGSSLHPSDACRDANSHQRPTVRSTPKVQAVARRCSTLQSLEAQGSAERSGAKRTSMSGLFLGRCSPWQGASVGACCMAGGAGPGMGRGVAPGSAPGCPSSTTSQNLVPVRALGGAGGYDSVAGLGRCSGTSTTRRWEVIDMDQRARAGRRRPARPLGADDHDPQRRAGLRPGREDAQDDETRGTPPQVPRRPGQPPLPVNTRLVAKLASDGRAHRPSWRRRAEVNLVPATGRRANRVSARHAAAPDWVRRWRQSKVRTVRAKA
jgi:hypothetical protein